MSEDLLLSDDDIPRLLEALVEVSDKWEVLGIAVGLPKHVREQCRHDKHVVALGNILSEWVTGNYKSAVPATFQNLKQKLESEVVGEGRVAQNLDQRFLTQHETKDLVKSKENVSSPRVEHLIRLYSVRKEVPRDTWPPVGTTTFINLVHIKQNGEITLDYDYSVQGTIDDIIKNKQMIQYKNVFGSFKEGGLILVEGRPGSGKTTLVHKVARDWATGEDVLTGARMVFLIPLRVLHSKKNYHTLSVLLSLFYWDKSELESVVDEIKRQYGKGVCFILDGLDEYQLDEDEEQSIINPLIFKTVLPHAMVIVVSRPAATADLKNELCFSRHIEVIGFSTNNIYEYINKFPFDHTQNADVPSKKRSQLKEYVSIHHNILHMCYLPVHAAMICFLYQYKDSIPHTETKIYEEFTRLIILRSFKKKEKHIQLISINQLRGEQKLCFFKLCQLAFDMITQSKQVIHQNDTEVSLSSDPDPLGLITIDQTVAMLGYSDTYTFLHLTLQEYLAAYHIASLEIVDQVRIVNQYGHKVHMGNVLVFYSGMTQFTEGDTRLDAIRTSTHRMRCAFESQQHIVCDAIVGTERKIKTGYDYLTSVDIIAIAYVLQRTSHPPTDLTMVCTLTLVKFKEFFRVLDNSPLKLLQKVTLKSNHLGPEMVPVLLHGLRYCASLISLELTWNELGLEGVTMLVDGLNETSINLNALNLWGNNICSVAAKLLLQKLNCCGYIQSLNLGFNGIRGDIFGALNHWVTLRELVLSHNHLLNVASLIEGLHAQSLKVSERELQRPTTVISNDLNGSDNLDDSTSVTSTTIEVLELCGCGIDMSSIKPLVEMFKFCRGVRELDLSENSINSEAMSCLCSGLMNCAALDNLKLRDADIDADGAVVLAEWLKNSCTSIASLDVLNNNLGSRGKQALLSVAAHKNIRIT